MAQWPRVQPGFGTRLVTGIVAGVDVHARDPRCEAATRRRTTHCIVVFVAMDTDGKPIAVPAYVPETDEEHELQAYAMRVMAMRQAIDAERKAFLSRAAPV